MKKRAMLSALIAASVCTLSAQTVSTSVKSATVISANPAAGAPKLLETVTKKGNELVIPYKKYQLANGLILVVHEDHSDPVVYVDVTYHVGSAREQQGRSGFAHFFEHMMFQGSKHVADEQHFKIITEAGGTLNGSTNTDRTNYFETVPSNQLEKMLWLESDRMGFLLDSVTQLKFEVQRATVKNERGQRYDNAPYGVVGEKTGEALYPKGHPYSWTTIGYIEDLNRVDVNDLKRFYMRWYGPNNAVLTVAGDVNTDEVVKLANQYFGSIPMGPAVNPMAKMPAVLTENRYISYEDNVRFPMLKFTFPTVAAMDKDEAALNALGDILSSSKSSPFYVNFIKTKKAVSANAYNYSRELAGQFEMVIRANAGTNLADIEKQLRTTLDNWAKTGATNDDIAKFKASYQSNLYNGLATVQGKGTQLAANQTYANNPNYLKVELANVMKLTKEDVMRVYNTYIKGKNAVILSCVPKGKGELKAHEDTWKMYDRTIEQEGAEYKNLSYTEPKDNFDRAKEPKAQSAKLVPLPAYWESTLPNKATVIGINSNEIPKVSIQLSFWAGHRFEPKDKAGLAYMLTSIMEESTEKHSAEQINDKLDRLGSEISLYTTDNEIVMNISCLKQNIDSTLAIAKEMLFMPKFSEEDFELVKKEQLDAIANQATQATTIANNNFAKLIYGRDNIMAIPSVGTAETVNKITIVDLKSYYKRLSEQGITVAISGDISKEQVLPKIAFLDKLPAPTAKLNAAPVQAAKIEKTRLYFIDKKGAPQSEIRVGVMAMPYDATGDYYKNTIMNYAFAGAFNSRINYLLREVRGFTYGARGGFNGNKFEGPYVISAGVRANATDSSVVDIMSETKKYADNGTTDEELSFTRNAMGQADALKYESPFQKLGFVKRLVDYNLDKAYVAQQAEILKNIKKDEISAYAKKSLPYNNMVILVVGDKASNLEKLQKLGYEVVELDLNGEPVK